MKYLGELYNYRMVESSVIFKTLYSFITFGVSLDGRYKNFTTHTMESSYYFINDHPGSVILDMCIVTFNNCQRQSFRISGISIRSSGALDASPFNVCFA